MAISKTRLVVKSEGKIVATPECEVFGTVEDCVEKFGEGGVVEMVNALHQQRVGNAARTDATEWRKQRDKAVGAAIDAEDFEKAKALRAATTREEYEAAL